MIHLVMTPAILPTSANTSFFSHFLDAVSHTALNNISLYMNIVPTLCGYILLMARQQNL